MNMTLHLEKMINAVIANDASKVQELLNIGLDPNSCEDQALVTPLHFAAQHNSQACAEVLMLAGAKPEALSAEGMSAIDVACLHQHEDMAELLRRGKTIVTH